MMKRTVIISGGTKGLGREISLAFGRAGYFAVVLYSADDLAARELEVALGAAKTAGCVLRHDACCEDVAIWNRPEIQEADSLTLIHNACAPFSPAPMHHLRWQDFEASFNVAVKGGWRCSQALLRMMLRKGRGTIVNILTSALEENPPKGFGAYLTAKHALRGFTLALAAEYAGRGVRVLSASPGFMNTPLTERWDSRVRDLIQSASTRITNPAVAAKRLVELVESETVAGNGEDYPI
ncbi:MAG: SDR family oxidoreductase [Chthoniobacter sp.]|nr:SDR family oxidoreductase [Chthoniobacter sp.]